MIQYMIYFASMFRTDNEAASAIYCTMQEVNTVEHCTPVCEPVDNCKPENCPVICSGK